MRTVNVGYNTQTSKDIIAAVDLGISNAHVEAINNKIKITVKMGRHTSQKCP
ncbi:MAG: transposase [Coriobacteriales bacterium]|nr:transposase [Coriobacteriales bacterium]